MSSDEKIKILVVDDRPENLMAVEGVLERPELSIITATSGNEALGLVLEHTFALILLDVQMPGMDGFEVAELLRGSEKSRHIPIIFLTAISKDDTHVFTGYEKGAVDYLFKPLDPLILRSKANVFVELFQQRKKLQQSNLALSRAVAELEAVNRQIREQQKSVIEEERLKVLLQMAGATAHELNQPLMILMGNVQLMEMEGNIPAHLASRVSKITEAANRISDTVKKIQTLRHDQPKTYAGGKTILNLDQHVSILAIEDKDDDFAKIRKILQDHHQLTLTRVRSIRDAFSRLDKDRFDLIFLDYLLPDGTGLDFLEAINNKGIETPAVVITGQGDELIASRIIQAGACDYLPKAKVSGKALLRIISNALEKAGLKREMRMAQEKLAEMSVRDELTGMFNRRYFREALEREISGAQRYGHGLALCMIDLDHFKRVNDAHGHLCGDRVLQEFGRLLNDSIRKYDVGCRYGGEEFAVILPDTSLDKASALCERFRQRVKEFEFTYEALTLHITASVGVAARPAGGIITGRQLVDQADKALYQAKSQGRDRVVAI
ncbi:MAG: diguanylate cyclase [Desulfobacteraceae bacterium]|jgi:two-component system cell cycle response regulator|nr:diguanylate cyclase [Desulfobacteraceae bacterium]